MISSLSDTSLSEVHSRQHHCVGVRIQYRRWGCPNRLEESIAKNRCMQNLECLNLQLGFPSVFQFLVPPAALRY
jgi:hypothetical protein